jgi:pimeloyl-ACP methyl ester carboxylesterase
MAPGSEQSGNTRSTTEPPKTVAVSFRTSDGLTICGDFADAKTDRGVVLLHQWNADASTWRPYLTAFVDKGISVLAIDARGYGRSEQQGNQRFAPTWDIGHDVAGAVELLQEKGCKRIGIAGSSYGANNALLYAAAHPEVLAVALLSPGENYHGLKIADAANQYKGKAFVLLSEGDRGVGRALDILRSGLGDRLTSILLKGDAHGTRMLEKEPDLVKQLVQFFHDALKAEPAAPQAP